MITPDARGAGAMRRGLGAQRLVLLHPPARAVLLRLRQGRAVQGVRRPDRPQGRHEGLHDDRPQQAARGARGDRATTSPASAPRRRSSRSTRATATSRRWPRRRPTAERKFNLAAQGHRQPGLGVQGDGADDGAAPGRRPGRGRPTCRSRRRSSTTRVYGKFEIKTYSGSGAGTLTLRRATLQSDNSVYIQLAHGPRPGRDQEDRARHGHPLQAQRLSGRDARRPGERRLAARDGDGVRHASPPAASATARRRSSASSSPTATSSRASRCPGASASSGRRSSRTASPPRPRRSSQQNMLGRHRDARPDAAARRPARPARRTTTPTPGSSASRRSLSTAVWVGYPDSRIYMNTLFFGGPVDGGTFPAAIWGEYMCTPSGNYCGSFPPPKDPFVSQPFYGKYASSGGAGDRRPRAPPTPSTTTPTPGATQAPPARPTPDDDGDGAADATTSRRPTQYESPPQARRPQTPPRGFDPSQYQDGRRRHRPPAPA